MAAAGVGCVPPFDSLIVDVTTTVVLDIAIGVGAGVLNVTKITKTIEKKKFTGIHP